MTLSNCLERRGDFRGATQALIAALSAAPADERTLYWSFHISKRLAQRAIMELAAAAPNSPSLGLLRAELFEQNGQYAEAEREYRSVIGRAGATAESFIRYGKFMCKTWRLEEAIPLYQRAMKLEPENPRVRGLIGEVHLLGERPETALPYLQAAVEARPRDEQSRLYLARCLDRLGRPQQAIAVLEAAPFDSDGRIHYALGSLYRLQGEQEKARQAFEEFRRRKGARR